MNELSLRNDRLDSGAWFFTAAGLAIVGLLCLCGLVAANVRDPRALWMGPSVKSPQGVYLFLEFLALFGTSAMAGLAVFKAKKFFDRSVQLVIDGAGIRDLRAGGREVPWSEVAEVKGWALYSGGLATAAQLRLVTKDGPTVAVDILGLDRDHKAIVEAAQGLMRAGSGGGRPGKDAGGRDA